ncbi:uncharacterized protein LODBEIA_P42560 [Lodderomyces beijingensis]|uniref:Uncharacterized protein n=1 Tax=Lodderomyces beijingensis TaxID=1775926 RepID=A0ABP0ZPH3_9ASCO
MKVAWIIHLIKINIVQVVLNSSRNPSISLQYLDSPIFASRCSPAEPVNGSGAFAEQYYNNYWSNNFTDIPDGLEDIVVEVGHADALDVPV